MAALHGRLAEHHRFLLKLDLTQIDALEGAVAEVEARIREDMALFQRAARLLITIPGVSDTVAVLIAEITIDMTASRRRETSSRGAVCVRAWTGAPASDGPPAGAAAPAG